MEDSAPITLLDLDANILITIAICCPLRTAAAIGATCKGLSKIVSDGSLWRALAAERWPHLGLWSLKEWGLPDHRALVEVLASHADKHGQFFSLLTDFPWCRLVTLRFELDSKGVALRGFALRHQQKGTGTEGCTTSTEDSSPLFSVVFRAASEPRPGSTEEALAEAARLGVVPAEAVASAVASLGLETRGVVRCDASVMGRKASLECRAWDIGHPGGLDVVGWMPQHFVEGDFRRAGRLGFVPHRLVGDTAAGARRAVSFGDMFYGPVVPIGFCASLHEGRDLLRLRWATPPQRTSPVDLDDVEERYEKILALPRFPPLDVSWVGLNLDYRSSLSDADTLQFVQEFYGEEDAQMCHWHEVEEGAPNCLALSPLPRGLDDGRAAYRSIGLDQGSEATLPEPGLYTCSYGDIYEHRRVETVALRVVRLADFENAEEREQMLRTLHLDQKKRRQLEEGAPRKLQHASAFLAATKVCGDFHVPCGATSFYAPLVFGPTDDPFTPPSWREDGAWRGGGCLAYPGFGGAHFEEARLRVLDEGRFSVAFQEDTVHVYTRLRPGDAPSGRTD